MNMLRIIQVVILSVLLSFHAIAQGNEALQIEMQKAQRAFDGKKYNTAAGLYKKLYTKVRDEEQQNKVLFMIAESYRLANNFSQAYNWYEKLVNTKYPDPQILYSYGLLLKNFEKYEEAARQFNDYLFEKPNDANAKRELQSCSTAVAWKNAPEKFEIVNLESINTIFSDYAPFYVSEQLIWASSRPEAMGNQIFEWTGQKCSDFFAAQLQNDKWTKPLNLKGGINTNYNEGVAWFDSTATTVYFTQCNGSDGKGANCKIYEGHLRDGIWISIISLPFNSDSFSVGHPSMTRDGKRMYFSSNMPGGYGEKDIYYIDHNPNTESWGKPVNLGPNVNTNEDELFPFIDDKGMIYFSSKGHGGMGGLDIYTTTWSGSEFTKAQNLRSPINSGGDDFGLSFIPSHKRKEGDPIAYMTSNREGGKGDDDLYSIRIKPFIFLVKGTTRDLEAKTLLSGVKVAVQDQNGKVINTTQSNDKGEFTAEVPPGMSVMILGTKAKYLASAPVNVSAAGIQKDTTITITLELNPIPPEDQEFVLRGIYYDLDKSDLRPEAKVVLDSLVTILKNNPSIVIELASHTDSRAPAEYNITLSQKRAQSCVNYLVQHGISKERLVAIGYGETRLVNDCSDGVDCSEEEHQQNRRTAIRVLRADYKGK